MPLPIRISPDSAEPLYHQIATQMKSFMISGQLPPGTLLPSIRELAQETQCSVITIRRVYQDLENEGLVRTKQGTGTFVTDAALGRREQFQSSEGYDMIKQTVERIQQAGLTKEEIREMFHKALEDVFKEEKGQ